MLLRRFPGALAAASAFLVSLTVLGLVACEGPVPEPVPEKRPAPAKEPEIPDPKELVKEDVVVGAGAEAKSGDAVEVHYTGKLLRGGKQFDSSVGKKPFTFTLGKGEVIEGWDEGVAGMKVGGKRKLTIPSRLAYKEAGSPPNIPPDAPLVFDVELLKVTPPGGAAPDADAAKGGADTKKAGKAKGASGKGAKPAPAHP